MVQYVGDKKFYSQILTPTKPSNIDPYLHRGTTLLLLLLLLLSITRHRTVTIYHRLQSFRHLIHLAIDEILRNRGPPLMN